MTYNRYSSKYETVCHRCGAEIDDLYVLGQRDDGSEYERTDGSFGESDVYVCLDCLPEDETMMKYKYWSESQDAVPMPFSALEDPAILNAARAVSYAANWFKEQDWFLIRLGLNQEGTAIREWAQEMRHEMPDNDAWPQDFCDNVADRMDELADRMDEMAERTNP